jgi:DNA-binding CsgD family transcriptional regulator
MTRTKARQGQDWFSEMQRNFQSAEYRAAANVYDRAAESGADRPNDAVLLRARLFLKLDSHRVVPFLLKEQLNRPTSTQIARREMYLGTGYSRLGDFNQADKHFREAGVTLRDGPPHAELAAHITRRYLDERNLSAAEEWQQKTESDRTRTGKIRSEHLLSYIYARRERYADQARSLMQLLNLIGSRTDEYREDWYAAVHTLSVLARELPLTESAHMAKAAVDADVHWSDDFVVSRFQSLKAVAWCQALAGDELSCLRYLRLAQHLPVSPIWQTILYLDRSYFASIVGEHQWAKNEFDAAVDIADRIAWDDTSGEERIALLLLAELATRHAPKSAPFYIARFNNLGKLRSNLQHFAFDERLQAMASYAAGIVKLSTGTDSAADDLRSAWGVFDRIGYDARAALTALALQQATDKSRWLHLAEDKLERYPHSWIARGLAQVPRNDRQEPMALSGMQQAVTRLVCGGFSTDEIAKKLKISRNTVFNHLKVVYRKLGVNSRQGLVVEAYRRNMAD